MGGRGHAAQNLKDFARSEGWMTQANKRKLKGNEFIVQQTQGFRLVRPGENRAGRFAIT